MHSVLLKHLNALMKRSPVCQIISIPKMIHLEMFGGNIFRSPTYSSLQSLEMYPIQALYPVVMPLTTASTSMELASVSGKLIQYKYSIRITTIEWWH